jgi:hypothetical protein
MLIAKTTEVAQGITNYIFVHRRSSPRTPSVCWSSSRSCSTPSSSSFATGTSFSGWP